jgi:hypothetical protein
MSMWERNAAGFHYRVSYYKMTDAAVNVTTHNVSDWRQRQLIVESADFDVYQPFIVFVQAVNSEGEAPKSFLEKRIGFTGQEGKAFH